MNGNAESVEDRPILWTVIDVQKALGVGRTTVFNLVKSGDLASVQIGSLRRFVPADVVAWVDAKRGASQASDVRPSHHTDGRR